MRQLRASVLFIAAAAVAIATGCTAATTTDEESPQSLGAEEAYSSGIGLKLGGDYVDAASGKYPTLSLDAKAQRYVWDTGIRCVRAPCPSGETGRWAVYRGFPSQRYYVGLFSTTRTEHWFRVDFDGNGLVKGLIGVFGEKEMFVPKPAPVVGCEVMRCAAGTFCDEDASGRGSCVPYATCAATKCAGGNFCADRPIMCVVAPCPPTAPSCEPCPPPGTIDCMPPVPADRQAVCSAHTSVAANCPGVTFAF